MQSCPNIGGREVRRRLHIGYFSLFLTIATVLYIFIYNDKRFYNCNYYNCNYLFYTLNSIIIAK